MKTTNRLAVARLGRQIVEVIYAGSRIVWQAVRSCFGSGKWIGDKPWIGEEKWKGE